MFDVRTLWMIAALGLSGVACQGDNDSTGDALHRALASVTPERLRAHVDFIADDATEGREPGTEGWRMARRYIVDELTQAGVQPAGRDGTYLHSYPTGVNVAAVIPGTEPRETVVYISHYDHLGKDLAGNIFNGAVDDAGSVALALELARAFTASGYQPRRSILFLFSDEEEYGLLGADAVARGLGPVPTDEIVFVVSGDPVGRSNLPRYNWLGLFGLEHTPTLLELIEAHAHDFVEDDLVLGNRELIKIFASDQDPFLAQGIPAAWFVNAGFSYYHTHLDTPHTIQYDVMLEDVKFIAQLLDLVAQDTQRYAFVEEVPITLENSIQIRKVFEGFLASGTDFAGWEVEAIHTTLTGIERMAARGYFDAELGDDLLLLGGLATVFTLAKVHPGLIPPPFPAGATAALP